MTVKDQAIKSISELPNSASLEDIVDNILYLNKIHKGISQLDQGLGITTEEAKKQLLHG